MPLTLAPDLESLIRRHVASGRFESTDAVVRETLRVMTERNELDEFQQLQSRQKIAAGLAELRRGEDIDGDTVFQRLLADLGGGPGGPA